MKPHSLLSLLSPVLLLAAAVPAGVLLPEPTLAQTEQTAIPSQTFEGRLDENSQVLSSDGRYYNVHTFEGEAGQIVRIDMESSEFDTYLWLRAPDGSVLAQNDDVAGTNSRIVITLPTSGSYILWGSSYARGEIGQYTLTIQPSSLEEVEVTAQLAEADRLLQLGIQQYQVSQFQDALLSFEEALEIYQVYGGYLNQINTLINIGVIYRNLGRRYSGLRVDTSVLEVLNRNQRDLQLASTGRLLQCLLHEDQRRTPLRSARLNH